MVVKRQRSSSLSSRVTKRLKTGKPHLVLVHGGCFSGGKVEWMNHLKEYLEEPENGGYLSKVPDFSLTNHGEAIQCIREEIQSCPESVVLVGISSGGFLSACVRNEPKVKGFVSLAGILTPKLRLQSRPDMTAKTLKHFQSMEKLELAEKGALKIAEDVVGQPGLYVVGDSDENLPPQVYESKQYETMIAGGELCKTNYTHMTICKPNNKTCEKIVNFLKELNLDSLE